jgi:hypothetical protein
MHAKSVHHRQNFKDLPRNNASYSASPYNFGPLKLVHLRYLSYVSKHFPRITMHLPQQSFLITMRGAVSR